MVTGASSGIGQQIASLLARDPSVAHLGIHYRENVDGAQETARQIESLGKRVSLFQADFASIADCERLTEEAWNTLRPEVWINNAGADVLTGQAANGSFEEKLEHLMRVDVINTIKVSRDVAQRMQTDAKQNPCDRSMIFIGWDQAPLGMEGEAGQMFGPVKAAVMAFAASLAQEIAPTIRVNTVCPGWIKTAWGETTSEYWDIRATSQSLMRRWGSPEDIARAICFAVDPNNTFLCGQSININGGWNRRFD